MTCACCGQDRVPETLAELRQHPDIKVCRECIGWLAQRSAMLDVTPTLPVRAMPEAISSTKGEAGSGSRDPLLGPESDAPA
jgi:hypothetical protein